MSNKQLLLLAGLGVLAYFIISRTSNAGILQGTGRLPTGSRYVVGANGQPILIPPGTDPWTALGVSAGGSIIDDIGRWLSPGASQVNAAPIISQYLPSPGYTSDYAGQSAGI